MTKVYVIWGPPASGKSTYVWERKGENDVIFDFDLIMEDISGRHIYNHNDALIGYILDLRDSMVERLRNEDRLDTAWLIISYPSDEMRARLEPLEPEYVLMEATREECKERIKADERRVPQEKWFEAVDEWFDRYEEEHGLDGQTDDEDESTTAQVEGVVEMSERRMRRALRRMLKQPSRLEIRNMADDSEVAELVLEGPVWPSDWAFEGEISPANVRDALAQLGDFNRLVIYLNSPGGDPYSAHAIHSMLRRLDAEVVIHIDGIAASAASIIAVAADRLVVAPNSTLMIHSASSLLIGWFNSQELRKEADIMDKVDKSLVAAYAIKTGRSEDELEALVKAETWLVGSEIVEAGFADELLENKQVAAFINDNMLHVNGQIIDLSQFRSRPNLPEKGQEPDRALDTDLEDRIRRALERGDGHAPPPEPSALDEPQSNTERMSRERHQPVALSYFERKLSINERMMVG